MAYKITVEEVPARKVIARRLEVETEGIGPAIQQTLAEVYSWMPRSGFRPAGEPFVVYHDRPGVGSGWRIEICAPVAGPEPSAPAGYRLEEVPGGDVATTTHVGPYDELGAAYESIEEFIRTHEVDVAGPPREIYLSEPDVPPDEIRTRVEFPVHRVPLLIR